MVYVQLGGIFIRGVKIYCHLQSKWDIQRGGGQSRKVPRAYYTVHYLRIELFLIIFVLSIL